MILRRKNLRNKSPKSKVPLKNTHSATKKFYESRLSTVLLSSRKAKPAINSGFNEKDIDDNIFKPKNALTRRKMQSLSSNKFVKNINTTKLKKNPAAVKQKKQLKNNDSSKAVKKCSVNISLRSNADFLMDKRGSRSITSVSMFEVNKKKKSSSQNINFEDKNVKVTEKKKVSNKNKKAVSPKYCKEKTNCKKQSLSVSNLDPKYDLNRSSSPHQLKSSTSRNSSEKSEKQAISNNVTLVKKKNASLKHSFESKTNLEQSICPIDDLVTSCGDETYVRKTRQSDSADLSTGSYSFTKKNLNLKKVASLDSEKKCLSKKQDKKKALLTKTKSTRDSLSTFDDLHLHSSSDDSIATSVKAKPRSSLGASVETTSAKVKNSEQNHKYSGLKVPKNKSIAKKISDTKNYSAEKKSHKKFSAEPSNYLQNMDKENVKYTNIENSSAKKSSDIKMTRAKKNTSQSAGNIKKKVNQNKSKKPTNREKSQKLKSSDKSVTYKEDLDNELSNVEPEKILKGKKSKRPTSSAIKNASASFSKSGTSQRKSKLNLEKESTLKLNVPLDDLTAFSISTPPTIEKLFTNSLNKKRSVTSTPARIKKNAVKEISNVILSSGITVSKKSLPGRGSLKRKRWIINSLKQKNEGYEDDLFENCSMRGDDFLLDESDFSDVSIATPKCAVLATPNLPVKTPHYRDCYSPAELFRARKVAEEYMHRRNKKRKGCESVEKPSGSKKASLEKSTASKGSPEKQMLDFDAVLDTLSQKQCPLDAQIDSDEEEDVYFSDVSF